MALVAGGTGITPIYQVICKALHAARDEMELSLLYCNRSEADVLLRADTAATGGAGPLFGHTFEAVGAAAAAAGESVLLFAFAAAAMEAALSRGLVRPFGGAGRD